MKVESGVGHIPDCACIWRLRLSRPISQTQFPWDVWDDCTLAGFLHLIICLEIFQFWISTSRILVFSASRVLYFSPSRLCTFLSTRRREVEIHPREVKILKVEKTRSQDYERWEVEIKISHSRPSGSRLLDFSTFKISTSWLLDFQNLDFLTSRLSKSWLLVFSTFKISTSLLLALKISTSRLLALQKMTVNGRLWL